MGKLIRNGIEYGGGNGTDIFEVTQAEYDALVQAGTLVHNALYVITDAPNLNETAKQISYDGGTATVWDKVESKQDKIKVKAFTATSDNAGNIEIPDLTTNNNVVLACMSSNGYATSAVPSGNKFYFKILTNNSPITPMGNQTTNCYVMYY